MVTLMESCDGAGSCCWSGFFMFEMVARRGGACGGVTRESIFLSHEVAVECWLREARVALGGAAVVEVQ